MTAAPERASLAKQTFWLLTARIIGFVFAFAMPLVLVRIFDQDQVGLYRQGFLLVSTCQNFLPLGFHVSSFYYLPRETERRGAIILNIVLFLGIMGTAVLLLFCLYPQVIELIFRHDRLTPYAPILGITIFLWIFSSFLEMVATANQEVRYSTAFILSAQFSKALFLVVAALVYRSVPALFYAAALQGLLQSVLLLWYLQSRFPRYWRQFQPTLFREQLSYSLPFGAAGVLYTLGTDFHSYLVANRFRAAQYALYSVGAAPLQLIGLLRDSLISVLLSRVSEMHKRGQHQEIKVLVLRSVRKLSLVYLPAMAALMVLGRDLVIILYRREYEESWVFLAINALLLASAPLTSDPIFRAYSEHRFTALRIRIVTLVVMMGLTIAAVDTYGMLGCMAAFVLAMTFERVLLFARAMNILDFVPADWSHLRGLIPISLSAFGAAVITLLIQLVIQPLPTLVRLCLGSICFGLVYVGLLLLTRALETEEKTLASRYLRVALSKATGVPA